MDVNNGEILSLASIPSYDPNKFWEYNFLKFLRVGILKIYLSLDLLLNLPNLALALEEKVIQ